MTNEEKAKAYVSRAEKAALKAYPPKRKEVSMTGAIYTVVGGDFERRIFQEGYEAAEKDLALTPDDIKLITKIHYEIVFKDTTGIKVGDVASEVLKRYLEAKK